MERYFNFSELNTVKPKKGSILISEPFLEDDYFSRSVVLLCDYNEKGVFGFVLNKFLDTPIQSVMPDFPCINTQIGIGGPVDSNLLFFIHTKPLHLAGSIEIIPGVYMGGQFEEAKKLLKTGEIKENDVRFFLGYSGWEYPQIQEELSQNAWFVSDISLQEIMNTRDQNLWQNSLKKISKRHEIIAGFPANPELN